MITVLFLETSFRVGGTEMSLSRLIQGLDRCRFRPLLCCFYGRGALGEKMKNAGVPVHENLARGRFDLKAPWRLWKLLKKEKVDVLYMVNQPLIQFWGTVCAMAAGVRVRIAGIGSMGKVNRIYRRLFINRLVFPFVTRVRSLSVTHKNYLVNEEKIPPGKIVIIPNGIEVERFLAVPDTALLRKSLGIREKQPVAGIVAMLRPEKGHETFLRAAARVLEKIPDACFLIIGEGEERPRLEALVSGLGLSEKVHFLGVREDIPALLHLTNVTVLSSRPVVETLSNAVLEYMAAAKPVVSTRVGSLAEQIEEGKTGYLVEPGDSEAMAEKIIKVFQEPALASDMGKAARSKVLASYTLAAMIRQMENLFETLLREESK